MVKYGLDAPIETSKTVVYGVQHMILFVANSAIMPVIVAKSLGLEYTEISDMLLRTLFLCGVLSIIQTRFGHRYPIIDGPGGLWITVLINLGAITSSLGGDFVALRTSLELGMLISGVFLFLLGISGKMKYVAALFSPMVNGVFLVLMPIQLSKSFVLGMLGNIDGGTGVSGKDFIAFWITALVMLVINIKGKGFLRSIAILIGVAVGWVVAAMIGIADFSEMGKPDHIFQLPQPFAWGTPTVDAGIILTCVIGSFLLFANVIASFVGMADVLGEELTEKQLNRGTMCYGLSSFMTGVFPTVGFTVFAISMGIVRLTGVATRKPFYLGSVVMIVLGLFAPIGLFFATIPSSVGYGAMMVLFAVIVKQGVDCFQKANITERKGFALGVSMLAGTGIMMQPFAVFQNLPNVIVPFASNGLLVGVILAIVLEQILKDRTKDRRIPDARER
ncbi:MAG: purine/pyrimidine permease [Clostridiales Family XIII bacterium]|jgi:xanthine/uracil permease|nr:purine/pyrimidine permease [Clostridiales Family XIII bacterium]